ncbi:thioredoxin reductase 1, cytoplasmic isoform X1 [Pelobates cultripes]|uniref:Thioredoxin reductase 1, cytoplasmic n=1 Tax=Pelobates cultripes TaxID=61616 RepID=A0AAD1RSN4_PELCU|nr:thioredoxin reductase 1, cytoplasmic isoform X1 [Pelobates cultripes]
MGNSVKKGKAVFVEPTQVKSLQLYKAAIENQHIKSPEITRFRMEEDMDSEWKRNQEKTVLRMKLEEYIGNSDVVVFSKTTCGKCTKVKSLLDGMNISYQAVEIDQMENGQMFEEVLCEHVMETALPSVFVKEKFIGEYDGIIKLSKEGLFQKLLEGKEEKTSDNAYDYDLIVIGGGSGGLAASKEATQYGKKVLVLDYVTPSPLGTQWGLGGTCVNVGCIPKKLMHQAALLKQALKDCQKFGWQVDSNIQHSWETMTESIQSYIGSLNWNYRVSLLEKEVKYENGYGEFVEPHKIKTTNSRGKVKYFTAEKFIIATGERPRYLGINGDKEYCITSDDLFSLPYCPGKTLVVGASYVALECAGFLAGLGLDVTVMVRSILLRGFDQQMATKIGDHMEEHGVKFIRQFVPTKIEQIEAGTPGKLLVTSQSTDGTEITEEYNTVLLAIGRDACTRRIGLEIPGVKINEKTGKIPVNDEEQTNVPYIYAIGDVLEDKIELTPVAIQAGRLLARRLYGDSKLKCDYVNVPTTVFTPLEYGACGLSEENAILKYGEENIEVYHSYFWPLEWTVPARDNNKCYAKIICNLKDNEKVIGFHVLAPNAGEITQGFAAAIKCGLTKDQLDYTIGIHPVCAEIFTTLTVTKRSGGNILQSGC